MRKAICFFVGGFTVALIAVTASTASAKPKTNQGQSQCSCGCAVQGGVYSVTVAAPSNDPSQCGNLNSIACTMGPSAGSNNHGKLQDCKGEVVVGKPNLPDTIKVPPGPAKQ